jgi:hypothetical protein
MLLQKVLDAVPVPVFVTFDRDARCAEASRAGLEALGMAVGQASGSGTS